MILQTTPSGATSTLTGGAIGGILSDMGVPYAESIGAVISFAIAFIAIYLIGKLLIIPLVNRALETRNLDRHAKRPMQKIVWILIIFVGITVAFGFAGFENFLQSLATIAAAATLAIGFAMQDVLKNFVAGIFIFTDKPFRIGDWIEWDDHAGIVEDISLRVTRIQTFDNELLTVPNSHLTDGVIKNPVAKDTLRLKFVFGIGYGDDIDEATKIILEEAKAHEGILEDPEPSVRLTELADSYVGLQARIWISNPSRSDFTRIRAEFVKAVKARFDAVGIEIPFPQRDLNGAIAVDSLEDLDDV